MVGIRPGLYKDFGFSDWSRGLPYLGISLDTRSAVCTCEMKLQLFALLSSAAIASASWAKNLNYRSPSENHPGLGIAIHKVVKRSDPSQAWDPAQLNFTHGVASGDPYSDSVILWTRAAPTADNDRSNVTVSGDAPLFNHDTDVYVEASAHPVCVEWKIATTRCFTHAVDSGVVYTSSDIDWTVKVSLA